MASIRLTKVIEKMKLENLTPELDITNVKITQPDINRPALQLTGYLEHFATTRLQVMGFVEYSYMTTMDVPASYSAGSWFRMNCFWRSRIKRACLS